MVQLADGLRVVDADSHMTERHDLFTERAPKGYEDKVPHVERIDGQQMWVIEGKTFGKAGSGGTIDHDGKKHPFRESQGGPWGIDDVHPAAWDPTERLQLMDTLGIDAQVLYPNSIGIGGQNLRNSIKDPTILELCIRLYNDAMAEVQEESGNRLLPMPIMPAWDIAACVRRGPALRRRSGYRGVNMTADPQDSGSPDLGHPGWDPFWEVCADLNLPVHFHIGASQTALWILRHHVLAQPGRVHPAGHRWRVAVPEQLPRAAQQRLLGNVRPPPEPHDGVGREWDRVGAVHARDHGLRARRRTRRRISISCRSVHRSTSGPTGTPRSGSRSGRGDFQHLIDAVGEDTVMFETDFPHPTCLHPNPLGMVSDKVASLRPETQRKVMGGNAVKLYRL